MARILMGLASVLVALAIGSRAAMAEPVTLICNNTNYGGTITIDIDEIRHTVTVHDGKNL